MTTNKSNNNRSEGQMPSTIEEVLAAWDAGEKITTCIMGGLSDDYEHGIHLIAMEKLRSMNANPFDYETLEAMEDEDKKHETWEDYRDMIYKTPNVAKVLEEIGPTGAMCGAAGNIATVYIRNGYVDGLAMIPEDRIIEVSKTHCVLPNKDAA